MRKKVIKSKMIRSDYLQVDCECSEGNSGLDSLDNPNAANNSIIIGDEMQCPNCEQIYHWGNYNNVKMTLVRRKKTKQINERV